MKIHITLSPKGIDNALNEIETYKNNLKDNLLKVAEKLAEYGKSYAIKSYGSAQYDGDGSISVECVKTETGYKIVAHGQAVCFIEFGAGVFYNGSESYLGSRPPQIERIGEYGKGKGKSKAWGFYSGGEVVITHGNPPTSTMYRTVYEMKKELPKIAKEVFGNDRH